MLYKSIINAVAVVVAVMAAIFIGCGGDDNPKENITSSDIVGDWIIYCQYGDCHDTSNVKFFLTFKSSGEMGNYVELIRMPDYYDFGELVVDVITTQIPTRRSGFWYKFEIPFDRASGTNGFYRVDDQKIWFISNEGDEFFWEYTISGNNLTTRDPGGNVWVFYKSDISATIKTLGTIYAADTALLSSDWKNPNNEDEYFNFGDLNYSVGSRLFILEELYDIDCGGYCDLPIMMTKEYDYNISTVNGVKTLTTRLVGPLGVLLPPDVWVSEDYYNSQSKAKSKNGNGAISPFWAFRR
jgi:hypothetical protein